MVKHGFSFDIQSYILWGILLIYLICAMLLLDEGKAHYYRYPWAFFSGHVFTRLSVSTKKQKCILLLLTFALLLPVAINSRLYVYISCLSIILLFIVSVINRKYYFDGKVLLGLSTYILFLLFDTRKNRISAYGLYAYYEPDSLDHNNNNRLLFAV